MRNLTNALVLVVFAGNCLIARAMLTLMMEIRDDAHRVLPYFTNLCISLRPLLMVLPMAALAYCLWLWVWKPKNISVWMGFVVVAMALLTVFVLPAIGTSYILMIDSVKIDVGIYRH
jgi:hypothetical protein